MDYYGAPEGFLGYCDDHGYDTEDLEPSPPETIETILRRGSVYIDGTYRSRFTGRKVGGRAQELEWGRVDAYDASGEDIPEGEIPIEIEQATYEAAFREWTEPGSLTPEYIATDRVKSETVGPLSVTYADSKTMSAADATPVIPIIDMILAPLLSQPKRTSMFGEVTR